MLWNNLHWNTNLTLRKPLWISCFRMGEWSPSNNYNFQCHKNSMFQLWWQLLLEEYWCRNQDVQWVLLVQVEKCTKLQCQILWSVADTTNWWKICVFLWKPKSLLYLLKVRKFQKQIFLFSSAPKIKRKFAFEIY